MNHRPSIILEDQIFLKNLKLSPWLSIGYFPGCFNCSLTSTLVFRLLVFPQLTDRKYSSILLWGFFVYLFCFVFGFCLFFWLFFVSLFLLCSAENILCWQAQLALAQRDEKSVQYYGGGLSGLYLSLAVCGGLILDGHHVPTKVALSLLSSAGHRRENITKDLWVNVRTGEIFHRQNRLHLGTLV